MEMGVKVGLVLLLNVSHRKGSRVWNINSVNGKMFVTPFHTEHT